MASLDLRSVADDLDLRRQSDGSGEVGTPSEGAPAERLYDEHTDLVESYYDAVRAIGEQVRGGRPLPHTFVPRKSTS